MDRLESSNLGKIAALTKSTGSNSLAPAQFAFETLNPRIFLHELVGFCFELLLQVLDPL